MILDRLSALVSNIHFAASWIVTLSSFHHLLLGIQWAVSVRHMFSIRLSRIKALQTNVALIPSVLSVAVLRYGVRFHSRITAKLLLAIWTSISLLLQMDHNDMFPHRMALGELELTMRTLVRSLAVMNPLVVFPR